MTNKKYNKSNIIQKKISFYGYSNDKKNLTTFLLKQKFISIITFYDDFNKFSETKLTKLSKKKEKEKVYDPATELYNKRF